tara:strand:+ start:381 stop:635 length:255 start_codon:yes stop_codon:yes gene_type:complete
MAKIHLDNSNYMEFIDEIATQMTEIEFKENMYIWEDDIKFLSEQAENFYNEKYDEIEILLNGILNIYSNNEITDDKNKKIINKK